MVAVAIGLILILTVALAVMAVVALPRLHSVDDVLTRPGRPATARAGQLTRETSTGATETTAQAQSDVKTLAAEGGSVVARPRPMPDISGPIPEIDDVTRPQSQTQPQPRSR